MKAFPQNDFTLASPAEETLRLLAQLPAPQGLEDRVLAGLQAELHADKRTAKVLAWPTAPRFNRGWMRAAAAAALVVAVVGGGWEISWQVQQSQASKITAQPPRAPAAGGFSNAGAMRTPQTLNGPVLAHPVLAHPVLTRPTQSAIPPAAAPTTASTHTTSKPANRQQF